LGLAPQVREQLSAVVLAEIEEVLSPSAVKSFSYAPFCMENRQ
jgi:hypothetical protein